MRRVDHAREDRHVQIERVDRNAARGVLANAAQMWPRIRRRDDRLHLHARVALRGLVEDLHRIVRSDRGLENHEAVRLFDELHVPVAAILHDTGRSPRAACRDRARVEIVAAPPRTPSSRRQESGRSPVERLVRRSRDARRRPADAVPPRSTLRIAPGNQRQSDCRSSV